MSFVDPTSPEPMVEQYRRSPEGSPPGQDAEETKLPAYGPEQITYEGAEEPASTGVVVYGQNTEVGADDANSRAPHFRDFTPESPDAEDGIAELFRGQNPEPEVLDVAITEVVIGDEEIPVPGATLLSPISGMPVQAPSTNDQLAIDAYRRAYPTDEIGVFVNDKLIIDATPTSPSDTEKNTLKSIAHDKSKVLATQFGESTKGQAQSWIGALGAFSKQWDFDIDVPGVDVDIPEGTVAAKIQSIKYNITKAVQSGIRAARVAVPVAVVGTGLIIAANEDLTVNETFQPVDVAALALAGVGVHGLNTIRTNKVVDVPETQYEPSALKRVLGDTIDTLNNYAAAKDKPIPSPKRNEDGTVPRKEKALYFRRSMAQEARHAARSLKIGAVVATEFYLLFFDTTSWGNIQPLDTVFTPVAAYMLADVGMYRPTHPTQENVPKQSSSEEHVAQQEATA